MSKSFAAPRTIRRIAARRAFRSANGKAVVLTIGVPQPVPGSDWGCALQITGLKTSWRRRRHVFGIDGLQALHLAMQCAGAVLESAKRKLEWLGQTEDLGMPKFLPWLPKPQQERFDANRRAGTDEVGASCRACSQGEDFEAVARPQADESPWQDLTMAVRSAHPSESA